MLWVRTLSMVAGLLLAAPLWSAEPALRLGDTQRAALQAVACEQPHGLRIDTVDAHVYGSGAQRLTSAEVRCAAHARFNSRPVHYVAQCTRGTGDWNCQGHWQQLQLAVGDEPLPVRVEGDLLLMRASQSIRAIANAGMFQGRYLPDTLMPPCYVHQGKGREFIDVKCSGWHIIVSTWCPQEEQCPRIMSLSRSGG